MSYRGKIDSRSHFIDLLSSTEKSNTNDYMLKSLVNKTKEDFKKRINYLNSKELYLNPDIYAHNIRKNRKNKTKSFELAKSQKAFKRGSIQLRISNLNKKSHSIGNINMFKSSQKLNKKIEDINSDILLESKKDNKTDNVENVFEKKNYDKLENLKSILELIDVHEKIQYDLIDEQEKLNLNMLRDKKKNMLFQPSITYQKNNLIYNKKYKLIYDRIKNINNIFPVKNKNKKNINQNRNLILDSLSTDKRISTHTNMQTSINKIQSQRSAISGKSTDSAIKLLELNKKKNKKLNIETTETNEITPLMTFSDSNILKTYSNTNNQSKNKLFKADIILKSKSYKKKEGKKEKRNKLILKFYTDVVKNYKRIKNQLNYKYNSDKKEEKDENEKNIKNLIKKKRTNIKLLIKELDLNYDYENLDLEKIIWKKRNIMRQRFKTIDQKRLLNEVDQQVRHEDKILAKKIILENNLEKKLNSRKKKLNEKKFEELTLKRKQLKHHLIGFKLQYETAYINKLMKFQVLNFNDQKSLQALLHKYKVMRYNLK